MGTIQKETLNFTIVSVCKSSFCMVLKKSEFYLLYSDVLNAEKLGALLKLTKASRDKFALSKTVGKDLAVKPDVRYRKSAGLGPKDFPEYKTHFKELLLPEISTFCTHFDVEPFESEDIQVQLTTHNDGDYYLWHRDKGNAALENRMVTFVYYFNFEPKMFTGGELVIYPPQSQPVVLPPLNNTMVMFDPSFLHEVKPVFCPGKIFENGRFSFNGWILKKPGPVAGTP